VRRALMSLPVALVALVLAAPAAVAAPRPVLYVGNNWDGTADVVEPSTFAKLTRLNIVPDKEQRLAEIQSSPDRYGYFLAIRNQVGEGHDQFVDDMFSSHDGRRLYVSRPSLADVVAFDLGTRRIVWRFPVEGYRADHMAISPDGKRLLVSASTPRRGRVPASSPPATSRTRTTSPPTAAASTTRRSARCTRRSTSPRSTPRRASACSRSSTRAP
jgi:hypothetical protein